MRKQNDIRKQDDLDMAAYNLGKALGLLTTAILLVLLKALLCFAFTATLTYGIFWCFGWEWNILIPIGIYLLAFLFRFMTKQ